MIDDKVVENLALIIGTRKESLITSCTAEYGLYKFNYPSLPFFQLGGLQSYFGYMFGECLKPYADTFDHYSNLLLGFEPAKLLFSHPKLLTSIQTDKNTPHVT